MQRYARILAATTAMLALVPADAVPGRALDAAVRAGAIDGVLRRVVEGYVYPDVARKMAEAVRQRAAKGEYDAISDGSALAERLTRDLRAVSRDLHVSVSFSAQVLPPEPKAPMTPTPEQTEAMRQRLARENFGLGRVEILKGNVGYLRFDYLAPPEMAAETYSSAMGVVANTDALILDLRGNGGSMSEDAIPMLCTYFFARPVHLIDITWRPEGGGAGRTRQLWTWAHVPGRRYLEKPIYILTSGKTFSGAEELAYDLKNLKRATLIGETTGGGANPGGSRRATDHFSVWVPSGRVESPITKTNWEGTGVAPDVAVPAIRALHVAHLTALTQLAKNTTEEGWKAVLKRAMIEVEKNAPRLTKVTFSLPGYPEAQEVSIAGTFNLWSPRANRLARSGDAWVAEVEAEPGKHAYKFIVDGTWMLDPANPETERDGEYTNSVRQVR